MKDTRADGVSREARSLFQARGSGATPTSALQLTLEVIEFAEDGRSFEVTTYGMTRKLCKLAASFGEQFADAIFSGKVAPPAEEPPDPVPCQEPVRVAQAETATGKFRTLGDDGCHAGKDGDCTWHACPQLRDDEPRKTGRHCPRDTGEDGYE